MDEPITDVETDSENPQSFVPYVEQVEDEEKTGPRATIVYSGGSEVVEDFEFIEERMDAADPYPDMMNGDHAPLVPVVRVWYADPEDDDSRYVDYDYGTITEVRP